MWRELIQSKCAECSFAPSATNEQCNDIEAALGIDLPPEFKALLQESNGIGDRYGNGVMCAEEIININVYLRSAPDQDDVYMPFGHIFFFATAGNGDMFFFPVQGNGRINNQDLFHWNHETDSRTWIAAGLSNFAQQWYGGQINV